MVLKILALGGFLFIWGGRGVSTSLNAMIYRNLSLTKVVLLLSSNFVSFRNLASYYMS